MSFVKPQRITALLLMFFLCFAFVSPLRAAAPAGKPPATVKTENSADDLDDISIDDLLRELDDKADKTGSWLTRERGALLRALAGVGVSVAAAALLLWLAHWFYHLPGRRAQHRLAAALTSPLIVFAGVISCFSFLHPVLKSLPKEYREWDLRCFYAVLVLIAAWGVLALAGIVDDRLRRMAHHGGKLLDGITIGMIGTVFRILVALSAMFFIGQSIFDLNITALLAGAGVVGLAVALAAKDTISNFFGTLVIIADAPFRIGDHVEAGGVSGIVEHVGMRSSKLRTADDTLCTVPNSELTGSTVKNLSRRGVIKHEWTFGLVYDTSPAAMDRALNILHELMDDFRGPDAPEYSPRIYFSGFGDSSLDIHAVMWFKTTSFRECEDLLGELNSAILKRFAEAGLSFAYPTRTLYVENAPTPSKTR